MSTPSLWEMCILPGCRQPVAEELDVCQTCRTVFGDYLHETDRLPSYTPADFDRRDIELREMYRLLSRHTFDPDTTDIDCEQYRRATKLTTTVLQERGEEERPGQRCWLCEEHRTCIRRPGG